MQLLKKRLFHFAILGVSMVLSVSILTAHAENLGPSPQCGWRDLAIPDRSNARASFKWSTRTDSPGSYGRAPYSIAVWGDSLTSARDFVDAALHANGIQKATIVPSFIQAGLKVPGLSLPLKASCATKGWQVAYAHKEKRGASGFSKGFVSMSSETPGDIILLDFRFPLPSTRVKALTMLFEKSRPDGSLLLGVSVDGGDENFISLSRTAGPALRIRPDLPMSAIRIRLVSGQITVHGFEPLYQDAPAAIVDTLSVPSALLRSWSNADERYFPAAPASAVDYNLVLVQYGTNEAASAGFDRASYLEYLRSNLSKLRRFYPGSRCILIGPPDRGVAGSIGPPASLKYSNVHQQVALAQRQVGRAFGCGFWDWQAAMGGPGTAARWAKMNPPQMQPDLTHLTAKGYEISGRMFATAFPVSKN
jgi:hypothetical protein